MRAERPRFALVRWPDSFDMTVPSCVTLDAVPNAVARGAILVGIEDEELCFPVIDVSQLHTNPKRRADDEDPA